MSKLEVDDTRCIGTGNCEFLAPDTFHVNDEGIAQVMSNGQADDVVVERAIGECPTMAIRRISDEE